MSPALLTPGPDGSPVPAGVRLIRLANEPRWENLSPEAVRQVRDGKALPMFFELSSEDKRQLVPRLSVWVDGLTTVAQAVVLLGATPDRRVVLFLNADEVRTVFAPGIDRLPSTPPLDIHWERATKLSETGDRVNEMRLGWEGHAGITNLDCGNKTQRNSLRISLAAIAQLRVLTPEEIATFKTSPETN